jgi:hypothetical protein
MLALLLIAAHAKPYVTHNTLSHGSGDNTWTAVLAGLIPILGIAALGIIIYAFARKGPESD